MNLFKRSKKVGSPYYVRYWDGSKQVWKSTGTPEIGAAKKIAAKILSDAALRHHGVIDDSALSFKKHSTSTIEENLKAFKAKLETRYKGLRAQANITGQLNYISSFTKFNGIKTIGEITADAMFRYVVHLQNASKSSRTISAMIGANKHFTAWLVKSGKLKAEPLASVQKPDLSSDRKLNRRMLLPTEWNWLLKGAESIGESFGLSVTDRLLIYRLAIQTGLRASEIRKLKLGSFTFGTKPSVKLDGGSTKNNLVAIQHIDRSLADELKVYLQEVDVDGPVFRLPKKESAKMLQADLAEARKLWLESDEGDERSDFLRLENHSGEKLDFHSLRHTCGAWLAIRRVQPKVIQSVMRHSTITLTLDTYGHILEGSENAAVLELSTFLQAAATVLPNWVEDHEDGEKQEILGSDRSPNIEFEANPGKSSRDCEAVATSTTIFAEDSEGNRMVRKLIRNQLRNQSSLSNSCNSAHPATHVLPSNLDSSLMSLVENWESISEPTKQMILKLIRLDLMDKADPAT
jgi:integrase